MISPPFKLENGVLYISIVGVPSNMNPGTLSGAQDKPEDG